MNMRRTSSFDSTREVQLSFLVGSATARGRWSTRDSHRLLNRGFKERCPWDSFCCFLVYFLGMKSRRNVELWFCWGLSMLVNHLRSFITFFGVTLPQIHQPEFIYFIILYWSRIHIALFGRMTEWHNSSRRAWRPVPHFAGTRRIIEQLQNKHVDGYRGLSQSLSHSKDWPIINCNRISSRL